VWARSSGERIVDGMRAHPIAELFPIMAKEDLYGLAEDIKANGLRHPLIVDATGVLIDGRNRLRACAGPAAGLPSMSILSVLLVSVKEFRL
jgi:hypothetical protein